MSHISCENVIDTLGRYLLVDFIPVVVDIEKSRGSRIYDAKTGKSYLDCISYIASNPIGHNHPKMYDAAFEQKLLRVARTKPSLSDFCTVEHAEFVDTFARLALPESFKHLFFVEGGALAVENALKTAFDWKVRKNIAAGRSRELGTRVVHFRDAFHGRTGYTLSLTNTADLRKTKYFPKFDWPRVLNPKVHFPLDELSLENVAAAEKEAEKQIRSAFETHEHDIAAILIEPIQGEGGDHHFRAEFHQKLRCLADEYEALLIYDEVQTGLGLTGKMWAYEHYGAVPDIVCFGKKTQVCGIMAGMRVREVQGHVFAEASRLNSTWGGSLTDMVRCERYLEIIAEDGLVKNAEEVGSYFRDGLVELTRRHSEVVDNARGKGLMCALDFRLPELRDECFLDCFKRGVMLLKCGLRSLRFRPALIFSKAEVDVLLSILDDAVSALKNRSLKGVAG